MYVKIHVIQLRYTVIAAIIGTCIYMYMYMCENNTDMKATTVLLAGHSRQYRVGSSCLSRCVQLVEERD